MLVVKIGGAIGINPDDITSDVAAHTHEGKKIVLVHGGSEMTTNLGKELGHPPRFVTSVSGHTSRYTDRRTLEIFLMATGLLNRQLVSHLQSVGVNSAGTSGLDGQLLIADRKSTLRIVENGKRKILRDDNTGRIRQVNPEPLRAMLDCGLTPVVAPVAISPSGQPLNIDGDRAAAQIATALGAKILLILSNVPGLLHDVTDENSRIPHLDISQLEKAITTVAKGRMKRKLIGCLEALQGGVSQVILGDGRGPNPIARALQGLGTTIDG